ncbi:MAG: hypothetical protein U0166_08535 [Acidobacteriota bacterium]
MSFDLYLHASEDQTRKIPKADVDAAMAALAGVSVVSKKEYAYAGGGYKIEIEVETETAAGGDVKGVYVHVPSGSGTAAYAKARELSLSLVDALKLAIYDHQQGSYVGRAAFEKLPLPSDDPPKTAAPASPATTPEPAKRVGGCVIFFALLAGAAPFAHIFLR